MNILYEENLKKTEVYRYKINRGGELRIDSNGDITITFINNHFEKAEFNFGSALYSRSDWRVLKAVEEKISLLEFAYENKPA